MSSIRVRTKHDINNTFPAFQRLYHKHYIINTLIILLFPLIQHYFIDDKSSRGLSTTHWLPLKQIEINQIYFTICVLIISRIRKCYSLEAYVYYLFLYSKIGIIGITSLFHFPLFLVYSVLFILLIYYIPPPLINYPNNIQFYTTHDFITNIYTEKKIDNYYLTLFYKPENSFSQHFFPIFAKLSLEYSKNFDNLFFIAIDVNKSESLAVKLDIDTSYFGLDIPVVMLFHKGKLCEQARLPAKGSSGVLYEQLIKEYFDLESFRTTTMHTIANLQSSGSSSDSPKLTKKEQRQQRKLR